MYISQFSFIFYQSKGRNLKNAIMPCPKKIYIF